MKKKIRLGTRGSPLALVQAEEVKHLLVNVHPQFSGETEIEIVPIRTTGDWRPEHKDRRFVDMGGNKGLFTKEIEDALINDYIDIAVHSLKDVSSTILPQLDLAAVIARADPRDAFIGRTASSLSELPAGAIVGTSSLRRQAQILAQRPDIKIVPLRGNVETRLKKLENRFADATVLAVAGMQRLGVEARISSIFSVREMLPAAGQGALGIQIRKDDDETRDLVAPLSDPTTYFCVLAERAVMRAVDGTCNTPAGAYATLMESGQLALEGLVARPDGRDLIRIAAVGSPSEADQLGEMLGRKLRERSPADLFAA